MALPQSIKILRDAGPCETGRRSDSWYFSQAGLHRGPTKDPLPKTSGCGCVQFGRFTAPAPAWRVWLLWGVLALQKRDTDETSDVVDLVLDDAQRVRRQTLRKAFMPQATRTSSLPRRRASGWCRLPGRTIQPIRPHPEAGWCSMFTDRDATTRQ